MAPWESIRLRFRTVSVIGSSVTWSSTLRSGSLAAWGRILRVGASVTTWAQGSSSGSGRASRTTPTSSSISRPGTVRPTCRVAFSPTSSVIVWAYGWTWATPCRGAGRSFVALLHPTSSSLRRSTEPWCVGNQEDDCTSMSLRATTSRTPSRSPSHTGYSARPAMPTRGCRELPDLEDTSPLPSPPFFAEVSLLEAETEQTLHEVGGGIVFSTASALRGGVTSPPDRGPFRLGMGCRRFGRADAERTSRQPRPEPVPAAVGGRPGIRPRLGARVRAPGSSPTRGLHPTSERSR